MRSHAEAIRLMEILEGTVVKDLRSLLQWARGFDQAHGPQSEFGGLNFTLSLVSLVACEVCGFYMTGAYQHRRSQSPNQVDPGSYSIEFINRYFPRGSYFKKLSKVLADFLRHDLVHGFGSANPKVPFRMGLFIRSDPQDQIRTGTQRGKNFLALNSIALAEHTISAFEGMKTIVTQGEDVDLIRNIVKAKRLRIPVSTRVSNQFEVVYQEACEKGLALRTRKGQKSRKAGVPISRPEGDCQAF
jgi:hypothetical protein